ncbi:clan AA aspartic protease [Flavobacterium sp.]|uniref:clan AA aspartic protease n=1 Tax=Flavobacterium sp. TaxID=239 RepID=UPI003750CD20
MGLVYADIELVNAGDIEMARRHVIGEEEIKKMTINMLVDSGAYNMCINESIQEQLDLPFVEKRKGQLANGSIEEYDFVGPVQVRFKNRKTICYCMVLPGSNEALLGAIPMEDLDVVINPRRQELELHPDHPYYAQMSLKGMRR